MISLYIALFKLTGISNKAAILPIYYDLYHPSEKFMQFLWLFMANPESIIQVNAPSRVPLERLRKT